MEFLQALPARVRGWRVVFDKPPLVQVGEGVGNIVPDLTGEALGVLYELTAAGLEHVELTEGVRIGNYHRVDVLAEPLATPGVVLAATSLASARRDPSLRPSRRYIGLLVEGALEHGLPPAYVDFLRAVPACEESPEAIRLRALIDAALRDVAPPSGTTRGR